MSRRKDNILQDLMDIAAKLPWWVGVGLALVSYLFLHALAAERPAPPTGTKDMGSGMVAQAIWVMALIGQYAVPMAFGLGAITSAVFRHRQKGLHEKTAQLGKRSALFEMSWQEFEGLVAEAYRRQGFTVTERGGRQADGGVDLILKKGSEKYLVQCKQWRARSVGVTVVRELLGVIAAEGAVGGYVVTAGEFTDEAKRFAEGRNITLVDGARLMTLIQGVQRVPPASLQAQPSSASSMPSCPRCGASMVKRVAKQGANAGQTFWGCSKYPACKGTRAIA